MDSLTRGLLDMGHQVKVVSIHTDKHPFLPDQIDADYLEQTQIEVAYADTELAQNLSPHAGGVSSSYRIIRLRY